MKTSRPRPPDRRTSYLPLLAVLTTMSAILLLGSCSRREHVYQSMGKEAVPPAVASEVVVVEEAPPVERVEAAETQHIHGPGCGHYYYDGAWHDEAPPVAAVDSAIQEAAEAVTPTMGVVEAPPPGVGEEYVMAEEMVEPPSTVVHVYEPSAYPESQVVKEYHYYPSPSYYETVYVYDDYPRFPWDYLSFSYASFGGHSGWGISFGYPIRYWRPYPYYWDSWWYPHYSWSFSYWHYPYYWWYPYHWGFHHHHHRHDWDRHDYDDCPDGSRTYRREDAPSGPLRGSRPIVTADSTRTTGGASLASVDRSGGRPVIPARLDRAALSAPLQRSGAGSQPRTPRGEAFGLDAPGREADRPVRAAGESRATASRDSLPRSLPASPQARTGTGREPVNFGEARGRDDVARLPVGDRGVTTDRISPPERGERATLPSSRSSAPTRDYGIRMSPSTRGGERPTIGQTDTRGVLVVPGSPARSSSTSRVIVVPPQSMRPEVRSSVRSPVVVSPSQSSRSVDATSRPSTLPSTRSPSSRLTSPRSSVSPEPRSSAPSRAPRVEAPPRMEAPSPPPRVQVPSPPSRLQIQSAPRSLAPSPRAVAPSRGIQDMGGLSRPSAPRMGRGGGPMRTR